MASGKPIKGGGEKPENPVVTQNAKADLSAGLNIADCRWKIVD